MMTKYQYFENRKKQSGAVKRCHHFLTPKLFQTIPLKGSITTSSLLLTNKHTHTHTVYQLNLLKLAAQPFI